MTYRAVRLASFVFAAIAIAPASADSFRLTYSFSFGSVLQADIAGTLQEDGNRVIVTGMENARLDGAAGPAMPFVTSLADLVDGTNLNDPVLTLNGIGNDFAACSDETCVAEFITFDGVRQLFGTPGVFTSPAFGNTMSGGANAGETYETGRYTLRAN